MTREPNEPDLLLLTAQQCAELCGASERQWQRWSSSGEVPAPVRKGRRFVRWHRKEVVAWVGDGMPSYTAWERKKELTEIRGLVG